MSALKIAVFAGTEASVNAYIIMNAKHAIAVDSLRNRLEAEEFARTIAATNRKLQAIFITHGHPDHFIGMRTLKEAFPQARILVASPEIKADIIGFANWMNSIGWLDFQPQMKPLSAADPNGFDYEGEIEVLNAPLLTLEGGGTIEIETAQAPMECGHMSSLYVPELKALLSSDICYNGVHIWAGAGVERDHLANWRQALGNLKARFAGRDVTVFPGHGPATGPEIFDSLRIYIDDFLAAMDSETSNEAAKARMIRLYPNHREAGFLLEYSVANHGPDKAAA